MYCSSQSNFKDWEICQIEYSFGSKSYIKVKLYNQYGFGAIS